MGFNLRSVAAAVAFALTVGGLAYSAAEIAGMRRFRNRAHPSPTHDLPPMTILKPLHGDEPQLYDNLRSFCEQEYPEYQIIFGSRDPEDPALDAARRLAEEFSQRDISVVSGSSAVARNPKIANLLGMIGTAKHDLLLIVDSDIKVGPEYLREIAAAFENPHAGAATCLYAGTPIAGAASQTGALITNDHFMPSVLVALAIEPLEYCFGSTMAVRRNVLEQIGGLETLGEYLADDFMLGQKVRQAGYEIALCPHLVRMTVADPDFRSLWLHHLRWQRTVQAARPRGFAGSLVTYVGPLALLFNMLARRRFLSGTMLGGALALRSMVHVEARKTFSAGVTLPVALIPLADAIVFGTWAASFFGSGVSWRGTDYELEGRVISSGTT